MPRTTCRVPFRRRGAARSPASVSDRRHRRSRPRAPAPSIPACSRAAVAQHRAGARRAIDRRVRRPPPAARGLLRRRRRRAVEDRPTAARPGMPVTDGQIDSSSVGAVAVSESHPDVVYIGHGRVAHPRQHHAGRRHLQVDRRRQDLDAASASRRRASPSRASASIPPTPTSSTSRSSATSSRRTPSAASIRTPRRRQDLAARPLSRRQDAPAIEVQIDANNPNVLYASLWEAYRRSWQMSSGGPGSGLFKSTDGGDTWTEITRTPGLPAQGPVGKIGIAVSRADSNRAVGAARARERRPLHERRRRRHVEAGQRRPQHPPARVLLLARLRRPEGPRHGLDAERQHVPLDRRRQDAARRPRAARRLSRPVDRPGRPAAPGQRQRRRRHGVDRTAARRGATWTFRRRRSIA